MNRKLLGDFAALLGGCLQSPIKWYNEKKEQEKERERKKGTKMCDPKACVIASISIRQFLQCSHCFGFRVEAVMASSAGLTLVTLLTLALSRASRELAHKSIVSDYTGYGLADAWAGFIWNRFPAEAYPLFLSPLIKAGRVQEG